MELFVIRKAMWMDLAAAIPIKDAKNAQKIFHLCVLTGSALAEQIIVVQMIIAIYHLMAVCDLAVCITNKYEFIQCFLDYVLLL